MYNHTAIIMPSKINKNFNTQFTSTFPQKLEKKSLFIFGFLESASKIESHGAIS